MGQFDFTEELVPIKLDSHAPRHGWGGADPIETLGTLQLNGTLTLGASGAGQDAIFYGDTASTYLHWDASADDLLLVGTATQFGVAGTTDASDTATGSIHTAGGVGIAKKLYTGDVTSLCGAKAVFNSWGAVFGDAYYLYMNSGYSAYVASINSNYLDLYGASGIRFRNTSGMVFSIDGKLISTPYTLRLTGTLDMGQGTGTMILPVFSDPVTQPQEGTFWYNTTKDMLEYATASGMEVVVSRGATQTLTNKTLGATTLIGKLTAGAHEIEGSNFDINGGDITGATWQTHTFTLTGNLIRSGAHSLTLTTTGTTSLTLPTTGTLGTTGDISTHAAIKAANATLGHVIVETGSTIDVDGDGKLTLGTLAGAWDMGSQNLTNVNIDSGTIDGVTITQPNINEAVALTATATELNLLDLAGMSTGALLVATAAATAVWQSTGVTLTAPVIDGTVTGTNLVLPAHSVNGTLAMGANNITLDASQTVDGVDVSAHVTDTSTHGVSGTIADIDDVITKAFIAAKGDIIAATGNDAPVIVSVGADNKVLTADSGVAGGVAWADCVPLSTDWKGNFNWDTSAYTTAETDISNLFSTNLAIATRRRYSVKLDLTTVEADGDFTELYLAVKEKIDGSNYRAIDRKTVTKANLAATAEPGIIIDIPATSESIQITMQMETSLAGDATIYYAVVKEHLE